MPWKCGGGAQCTVVMTTNSRGKPNVLAGAKLLSSALMRDHKKWSTIAKSCVKYEIKVPGVQQHLVRMVVDGRVVWGKKFSLLYLGAGENLIKPVIEEHLRKVLTRKRGEKLHKFFFFFGRFP